MYNGERDGFTVDGKQISENGTLNGNHVTMTVSGHKLYLTFVDNDQLAISDKIYYGKDDKNQVMVGGHTLIASSAAAKAHQFMTVLSVDSAVTVTQTYDTSDALAAMINYSGKLNDFVLFNRTKGLVAVGEMTTNAEQASVLGLNGKAVTDGFAATRATILTYGGKTLFKSDAKVNIVADSTGWYIDTTIMQKVTISVGEGNFDVFVNGKKVNAQITNGMASFTIGTGSSVVTVAEAVEKETAPTTPSAPTEPILPTTPTEPSEPTTAPTDPTESTGSSNETEATVQTEPTQPTQSETQPQNPEENDAPDNTIAYLVIGSVVISLAGFGGLILYKQNKKKSN